MPDEPLQDPNTGLEYRAYLTEARSIGGLSGSPVFAFVERLEAKVKMSFQHEWKYRRHFLLGLVRGHWNYSKQTSSLDYAQDEFSAINMGIAIVTPIQEVAAILNSPELVKDRRKRDKLNSNKKL